MKYYQHIAIAFILITLVSCATRLLTSNIKANELTDILYLEPFSNISLIRSGDKGNLNDTLSERSNRLLIKVANNYKGRIPISTNIILKDVLLRSRLHREISDLLNNTVEQKSISNLKIPPLIDSLLELNNKQFGLITFGTGFIRTKNNYSKEIVNDVAATVAVSVLSGGKLMAHEKTIKFRSRIYAMIVDAKNNNVIFFNTSLLDNYDPLSESTITQNFQKVFEGYFWPKHTFWNN
jgi:hypothetical protein